MQTLRQMESLRGDTERSGFTEDSMRSLSIDPVLASARPWRVSVTTKISLEHDLGTHTAIKGDVVTVLSMEDGHATISLSDGGQGRMRIMSDAGESVLSEIEADPWRVMAPDGLGVRTRLGGHRVVEQGKIVWVTKVTGNAAEIISPVKGTCRTNSVNLTPLITPVPPEERYDQRMVQSWQTMTTLDDIGEDEDDEVGVLPTRISSSEYNEAIERADTNIL